MQACPISYKQIDGTIARINAFFITLSVVIFLYTSLSIVTYILTIDFFIRLYINKKFSPIFNLSKITKKILNVRTNLTEAAPKRLAAYFGLFFSIFISIESTLGLYETAYITSLILLFCSSLELFFNYCLGCKIYYIIKKIFPSFSV